MIYCLRCKAKVLFDGRYDWCNNVIFDEKNQKVIWKTTKEHCKWTDPLEEEKYEKP